MNRHTIYVLCSLRSRCFGFAEVVCASRRWCLALQEVMRLRRVVSLREVVRHLAFLVKSRSLLRIPSILPRPSWARGKRSNRGRPKSQRFLCDKRIATKSGIRESNPPPRLGKPMHYRCANAAKSVQNYHFFFKYANIVLFY